MHKPIATATAVAVAATAFTGAAATRDVIPGWYTSLRKPACVPPNSVFPAAWSALYAVLWATSTRAIGQLRDREPTQTRRYVAALGANLVLNAGWSWLFFKYHRLGASAAAAAALTLSSADLSRRTANADRRAGLASLGYPVWCAFATAMSTHIWWLNR